MAVFLVLAPFPIKISFTNVHFPYKCRFSLQKYRSTKVDFPSYSVFRAFPVLQLLKHNQLKIILMSKRHILRWPTHSVSLHTQKPICLTDNLGKAWKPKCQSRGKAGGKTPGHWDKHPMPCHRAHRALSTTPCTALTDSPTSASFPTWLKVGEMGSRARIRVMRVRHSPRCKI